MARKSDNFILDPMYKPGPPEAKLTQRRPKWKTVVWSILSRVRGPRSIELKTRK